LEQFTASPIPGSLKTPDLRTTHPSRFSPPPPSSHLVFLVAHFPDLVFLARLGDVRDHVDR
jgi:hypothetical protein